MNVRGMEDWYGLQQIAAGTEPDKAPAFSGLSGCDVYHGLFKRFSLPSPCISCPNEVLAGFTEADKRLWRNSIFEQSCGAKYKCVGPRWAAVLYNYRKVLPQYAARLLDIIVKRIGRRCDKCVRSCLGAIHEQVLPCVMQWTEPALLYFLDLKVLGGYDTQGRDDEIAQSLLEFTTRPKLAKTQESERQISDYFDAALVDAVRSIGTRRLEYSFADFVSFRDAWAAGGSTHQGEPLKIRAIVRPEKDKSKIYSKEVVSRSKWAATLSMKDKEIARKCLVPGMPFLVRPFSKRDEPGKSRLVFGSDLWSHIRCSYMYESLKIKTPRPWTTVECGNIDRAAVRQRFEQLRGRGLTFASIDQSGFDKRQTKARVVRAMELLGDLVCSANGSEMSRVVSQEMSCLRRVYLEGIGPVPGGPWEHGLLSGFRMTALVGSLLNRAACYAVARFLGLEIVDGVFQGDDSLLAIRGDSTPGQWAYAYGLLGLEVNPGKTTFSRANYDYLHEFTLGKAVYGLPARTFKSIMWKKPNLVFDEGKTDVESLLDTFSKCSRRGLFIESPLFRFLRNKVPGSKKDLVEYLLTPKPYGGFGFGLRGRVALNTKITQRPRVSFRMDQEIHLPVPKQVKIFTVKSRVVESQPLAGYTRRYFFERVKEMDLEPLSDTRLESSLLHVMAMPSLTNLPRINWTPGDLVRHADAYSRKLILQHKLAEGGKILLSDIPNPEAFGAKQDANKTARIISKLAEFPFPCESPILAGETLGVFSDVLSRVWRSWVWRSSKLPRSVVLSWLRDAATAAVYLGVGGLKESGVREMQRMILTKVFC